MYTIERDYKHKKPRKRLKTIIVFTLISIVLLAFALSMKKSPDSDSSNLSAEESHISEVVEPKQPPYDFSSVEFPAEGQSAVGTLGFGVIKSNTETEVAVPMASITKLITVLAILEKAPITLGEKGDIITLNQQDEKYWHDYVAVQGTITPVTAGYEMSQYEALQAILLPSSNNMADSLVDRYFASREEYLDFANNLIKSYGLQNTRVADASGFSPESVSTPSDLIVIGQKILKSPVLAEIVAQPNANISVAGEIPNYNPLIEVPGVTGIKPGATDEAGYCLLFSADTNNSKGEKETVIAVVMGIHDRGAYQRGALKLLQDSTALVQAN